MVKASKSFRKQAAQADRAAQEAADPEVSANFRAMANAYRSQADVLRSKEKKNPKSFPKARK
jgi:hypothetical protein